MARHSGARRRGACLAADDTVVLTVEDDGVGRRRPPAARAPGWPGLRVRLEALGGTLQVTSPPGGPTEMRMECPCRSEDRPRRGRRAAARGARRHPRAGRPRGRRRGEDADALLAYTARHQPDVVVTDIRMPPTHTDEGLRAAAQIRAEHPRIAIMVLSAYVAEAYVPELLDATAGARRRGRLPAQGPGRPRARVPRQPRPGRGRRDRRRPGGGPAAARPPPRRRPAGVRSPSANARCWR